MTDALSEAQFQIWLQAQFDEETSKLEKKNEIEISDVIEPVVLQTKPQSPKRKRRKCIEKPIKISSSTKEINLFQYQIKHVKQLQDILKNHKSSYVRSMNNVKNMKNETTTMNVI